MALADLSRWRQEGRDVQASVNVGAEVLAAGAFLPTLQRRLREHDLPPGALCLELTESEVLSPEGRRCSRRCARPG
jgi:EAL domain-containing protein (putative c-di-GMP-specific phosphodiesterase class I)